MDTNSLMIHWGSQHNVDGAQFEPKCLNIENVSHYQCPVSLCNYKNLSINQVIIYFFPS